MKKDEIMCKLFNFSIATYYKRKREKNYAIHLIEKYASNEELIEFMRTEKITRFDHFDDIQSIAMNKYDLYLDDIIKESFYGLADLTANYKKIDINTLMLYVPIFILFEHIQKGFEVFEKSDTHFANDIIGIINSYSLDFHSQSTPSFYPLFRVDSTLTDTLTLFSEDKNFNLYYSSINNKNINTHAYFNLLYLKVNFLKQQSSELDLEEIKSFEFTNKNYTQPFKERKNDLNITESLAFLPQL